jgi:hypothetical protein
MKNLTKTVLVTALLGASATTAQAWWGPWGGGPWGGSPWSGSDTWGWGDIDASFRTTGWGRNSYYPWYGAPYGYGYGYPYYGAPYYGAPAMAAPSAPASESK